LLARAQFAKTQSRPSVKKKSLAPSGKSDAHFRASRLDQEGRFAIVTNVEPATRWTRCIAVDDQFTDERYGADGEIAWSWHPGADAKFAALDGRTDDGGNNAGPRGECV
jgi:hypothetical protein